MSKWKIGDRVRVTVGSKHFHEGVIVGFDEISNDTILVGVKRTSIPKVTLRPGRKFISIFYASSKQLAKI